VLNVVLIPVPEADDIVRPVAQRLSPERSFPRTVAHISLCGFKRTDQIDDAALEELGDFFAAVPPFDAFLDRVERFSSGLAYLAPEPRSVFDGLIKRLSSMYPETPPYGGQFDVVIPHMSLYLGPDCAEKELEPARWCLPIHFHVSQARLVEYSPTVCRDLASFVLSGKLD
jgi:hypothetical protein